MNAAFICKDVNPMCGQVLSLGLCTQDAIKQGCPLTCDTCAHAKSKAVAAQQNPVGIGKLLLCMDVYAYIPLIFVCTFF